MRVLGGLADAEVRIDALAHHVTDDGWLQRRSVLTRWWPNAASSDGAGIITVPGAGCSGLDIDLRPDAYDWPGHHGVCGTQPPGPRPVTQDPNPDDVVPQDIKPACPGRERFEGTFADVAGPHVAASDCGGMWELVRGVGPQTYGPVQRMSRAQLATMLARGWTTITEAEPSASAEDFSDNEGVHADAVRRMVGLGVTPAMPTGPSAVSSR